MPEMTVLVTGAAGFLGREIVGVLARAGCAVRAGVHRRTAGVEFPHGVQRVAMDLDDGDSLRRAVEGVDEVYHCAALVDARRSWEDLRRANVDGTRHLWEAAAAASVRRAVYCSSAAVYGLMAARRQPVSEAAPPCAIEPYGRSKLLGERAALGVAARGGPATIIVRPVAILGPGEHTPFGRHLKAAALSKILLAGGFRRRSFSFVHVEDAASAVVHLMGRAFRDGEIFNIAAPASVLFEDALRSYVRVLRETDLPPVRRRLLGVASSLAHALPVVPRWLGRNGSSRMFFRIWHPGFDVVYAAGKLRATGCVFRWEEFERVLRSCAGLTAATVTASPS